jgi:hypothetical protein
MDKVCQKCGRRIEYRKKWKKNWDQILYCSEKCRRSKNQKSYEPAQPFALVKSSPLRKNKTKKLWKEFESPQGCLLIKEKLKSFKKEKSLTPRSFEALFA